MTASGSAGPARGIASLRRSRPPASPSGRFRCQQHDVERYYEGMSNATLWPLYHDLVAKPEFHREWWESYVRVNESLRRGGRRLRRQRRRRLGAGLPAPARTRDAARTAPRPADRLLPAHPVPAEPSCSGSCRGATPDPRGTARRRPRRLPAVRAARPNFVRLVRQRLGHKTHRDRIALLRRASGPGTRRSRSRSTSPAFETARPEQGGDRARGADLRHDLGNPRYVFLGVDRLDYTKGIRAAAPRVRRADRERTDQRRGRGVRSGRVAEPRAGRAVPRGARRHRATGRADQRRPRPDRPPADPLPARVIPARGDGGALPSGRRDGGDAVRATA